jgi:hypothetical protein
MQVKNQTNICVLISLIIWVTVTLGHSQGAETIKRPVSARIEPKFNVEVGMEIGSVIVKYTDGSEETLTSEGNCMGPDVSPEGYVAWIVCELAEDGKSLELYNDVPVNSHLKICYGRKTVATLTAAKPFIENWRFAPDGQHVVIKSRAAHGVAFIELFALRNGRAESTVKAYEEHLPAWAEPFRDL